LQRDGRQASPGWAAIEPVASGTLAMALAAAHAPPPQVAGTLAKAWRRL